MVRSKTSTKVRSGAAAAARKTANSEAASSGRNRPGLKSANLLKGSVVYTQNPPTPAEPSPAVTFAHAMTLRPIRDGAHRSKRLKALAGTCRDIWKAAAVPEGISRDLP